MSPPRRFDWDEAKRLRAVGWTYRMLADHFGVTEGTIYLALNDAARVLAGARAQAWQRRNRSWLGRCIDCGGPATIPPNGSGRCRACYARVRTTTVRETELRCSTCGDWKPDESFTPQVANTSRRGRHAECKACAASRRREQRARARSAA